MKRTIRTDDGIGMLEVVVSMFLIALIAISFLPLLMRTLTLSTQNTITSAATQLVASSMDKARVITPSTCSAATTFATAVLPTVTDARGVVLQPRRELVGACPTSYPGTVAIRAWVTESGKAIVLAEATALVYVTGN